MHPAARLAAVVVLGAGALVACKPGGMDVRVTADKAPHDSTIRAHLAAFNEFLRAGSDSALASYYGPDGALLPPNEPKVIGQENIRRYWAGLKEAGATLVISVGSLTFSDMADVAVEEGTWNVDIPGPPMGPYTDDGKYVVIWRRYDGEWKIAQDIWNSNHPPPGMAADTTTTR
jgi:ketosteroid isomerase-like protein